VNRPSRRRLRLILLLGGIVPALAVFALLVKVAVMMGHDSTGREEFGDDDFAAAAGEFGANRTLNWFEPWIAPFDEGTAQHAEGDYDAAIARYTEALEDVPAAEECTVRINLALAHEALGDAAQEGPPPDGEEAVQQWQAGIDALAEGDCPTDAGRGEEQTEQAAAVDERLRKKLEQEQQKQQQKKKQQQQQPGGEKKKSPQEQDLDERNRQGQDQRKDRQEGGGQERGEGQGGGTGGKRPGGGGEPTPAW
jgi:hypothetical protein